jgi:hypothetical protein
VFFALCAKQKQTKSKHALGYAHDFAVKEGVLGCEGIGIKKQK